jgi:hypothetical protein
MGEDGVKCVSEKQLISEHRLSIVVASLRT